MKTVFVIALLASAASIFGDQPKVTAPAPKVVPGYVSKFQIQERIEALEKRREEVVQSINAINGAIADYKYMLEEITAGEKRAAQGIEDTPPAKPDAKAGN